MGLTLQTRDMHITPETFNNHIRNLPGHVMAKNIFADYTTESVLRNPSHYDTFPPATARMARPLTSNQV